MSKSVDYRETLVTYLNSEDMEHAANTLGVSNATLSSRLSTLRKHGVKVPRKLRKGISDLEIAQLNSIVKKWKEAKNAWVTIR